MSDEQLLMALYHSVASIARDRTIDEMQRRERLYALHCYLNRLMECEQAAQSIWCKLIAAIERKGEFADVLQ